MELPTPDGNVIDRWIEEHAREAILTLGPTGSAPTDRPKPATARSPTAGAHDDLGVPVPGRRVTAGDRLEARVRVVAAAADADLPPDGSGLDRHTLVLYTDAAALADDQHVEAATGVGVEVAGSAPVAADIVPVRDASGRVRGMERRVLRRLACDAGSWWW